MNIFHKSMLAAALIAGTGFSASALELVSPTEGATTTVESLGTITLKWDEWLPEDLPTQTCTLLNSEGTQVAVGNVDFNFMDFAWYDVTFVPTITEAGKYTVVVPAGLAPGEDTPEYRLPFEIAVNTSTPAEPTSIIPADGAVIVQDTQAATPVEFTKITFNFENDPYLTVNFDLITLTDDKGNNINYQTSGWWQEGNAMITLYGYPMVVLAFNTDGTMPSGKYTLTCKPGAFTSPRGSYLEEITCTYDYTRTLAEADDTPLEIESALMGHVTVKSSSASGTLVNTFTWIGDGAVEVTPDMEVPGFIGTNNVGEGKEATGFLVTFNHGAKSEYVTYTLINVTENYNISHSEARKQEDGSFLAPWITSVDFYEGVEYAIEFHAYNNVQDKVEFGDGKGARLTFKGTTDAFKYSPARYITSVPVNGTTIVNRDMAKVTALFSEPVKATMNYALGMGAGTVAIPAESESGDEYDTVWTTTIPASVLSDYPQVEINIVAYDRDGLIVACDDKALEDLSVNKVTYYLTFCQPRILLTQTDSHVPVIDSFVVTSSKGNGVNPSWLANPYVVNAQGKTVAELDKTYYQGNADSFDGTYLPLSWTSAATAGDQDPLELEFHVTPAITEKGKYTLVFPTATLQFGNQFTGETSVAQEMDFYVVDFYPVDYTVDNCTVSLSDVEAGKAATIEVSAAEGWKLEELTLNGEDVTDGVKEGNYTSAPATAGMHFAAKFAFDGITVTPTGVDDVVTDLKLRGFSQDGKLIVAGLKAGQTVNVFTDGGALMATETVGDMDTLEIGVPAGIYIVTVTEGNTRVALKLVNK